VLVPLSALLQKDAAAAVWVVGAGNVLELRPVTVRQYRETVAVLDAGVAPGEMVVTAGVHKLRAGEAVQPLADGALFGTAPAAAASGGGATPAGPR
jgi:multidrug efflux pump subunit AcrA (membrane-fusion protein)